MIVAGRSFCRGRKVPGPLQSREVSDSEAKPVGEVLEGELSVREAKLALVVSRFNEFITERLLTSAIDKWRRLGGDPGDLTVARVPGALELSVTARQLARSGRFEAVICLGCVLRGETDHYDHVVEQTAKGIREVGTQTGVPCIFGVITADTLEQAIHRAGAKMGNAGGNAMLAGIEMANLLRKV